MSRNKEFSFYPHLGIFFDTLHSNMKDDKNIVYVYKNINEIIHFF